MKHLAITIPRKELGTRAQARNKEIDRSLQLGVEYILMVDDDEAIPFWAINKLLFWIHQYDVVVIDAPAKNNLAESNVTYHPDGTIAWTGFGCALFKADIFRNISSPWFEDDYTYTFKIENNKFIFTKVDKYKPDNAGEDTNFYFKLMEYGYKVKIIEGVKCKHVQLSVAPEDL